VDRFPLPPAAPPIDDTSLTHVMRLPAHSTTSPTPTATRQSFINFIITCIKNGKDNVPIEDNCLSLTFVMLEIFCAIENLLQNIHI
jgi:hypothetical protein